MLDWIKSLDRVLKGEATRPAALKGGTIDLPAAGLSVVLIVLAAVYGACMGSYALVMRWGTPTSHAGYRQIAYSAAKVPMLFFLTLLVTFPSLYVFNSLIGSRLRLSAVLRLLIAALGVTVALLASFGTIVVFFSLSSTSYSFMVLLNVVLFALAGLLGMRFLLQTLHRMSIALAMQERDLTAETPEVVATMPDTAAPLADAESIGTNAPAPVLRVPPPLPGALDAFYGRAPGAGVKGVFRVWVLVFGLVGAQMSWMLRPFIGNPGGPVTFLRTREGNFFEAAAEKSIEVLTGPSKGRSHRGTWGRDYAAPADLGGGRSPETPATPATSPTAADSGGAR